MTQDQDANTEVTEGTASMLPSVDDIYDAFMGAIEPDLVSTAIPHLKEKYADETKAGKKKRQKRYKKAFKAYKKNVTSWMKKIQKVTSNYRKSAIKSLETKSKKEEVEKLADIEKMFDSATPNNA